jgi:uncharacterized membrane protein YkgB
MRVPSDYLKTNYFRMKKLKTTLIAGIIFLMISFMSISQSVAQFDVPEVEPISLNGPRLGFTYIAPGAMADKLDERGINPFITQFGWQVESRFFTLPNGVSGLVEAIGLIGGLEQNTILPSASVLIGIRSAKGFEIGVGPNLSVGGAAIVIAGGATIQSNYINFPINFAVVPSTEGVRFSLLFGFNAKTSKGFSIFNF